MRHELGVPVHVADDPLRSVALGAGRCVEEFGALQRVLVDQRVPVTLLARRRLLVVLLLATVVAVVLDLSGSGLPDRARSLAAAAVGPVQRSVAGVDRSDGARLRRRTRSSAPGSPRPRPGWPRTTLPAGCSPHPQPVPATCSRPAWSRPTPRSPVAGR